MISKIKAYTYYIDGGDGGGTTYVHPSLEHLKNEHFKVNEWTTQEKQDKKFQDVLDEGNSYELGEISETTISIIQHPDRTLSLADSFSIHWGQ